MKFRHKRGHDGGGICAYCMIWHLLMFSQETNIAMKPYYSIDVSVYVGCLMRLQAWKLLLDAIWVRPMGQNANGLP